MSEQDATTPDEEITEQDDSADSSAETEKPAPPAKQENMIPQSRLKEVVDERNELTKRLEKLEATEQTRLDAERIAEGKHEEVIVDLRKQLTESNAKLDAANGFRAALAASVQTRIDAIPESQRSLVPEFEDPVKLGQWLDTNAHLLTTPTPPPTDAGVSGDRVAKDAKLTPAEQAIARKFSMTDDQYRQGKLGADADAAIDRS